MGTKLKVQVLLPPVVDSDVVSREFSVAVDGDENPITTKLTPTAPSQSFLIPANTKITVTLVDVDAAGNRSLPKVQSFTPVDTIAPHQPGDLQFKVLEQVEDEDPGEQKSVAQ